RETIGRVGVVSLQDARAEAKRRLAEYTLGKEKPKAIAWSEALAEYLAEVERECKWRTHENYGYVLNRHFRYGATKLSEVSPHDINRSIGRLHETPAEQQRAFAVARAFIRWAH